MDNNVLGSERLCICHSRYNHGVQDAASNSDEARVIQDSLVRYMVAGSGTMKIRVR